MSKLTRDGTAEPLSRNQIFSGANGDRETIIFPVQLTTSRIDILAQLIHTFAISVTIHTSAGWDGSTPLVEFVVSSLAVSLQWGFCEISY